MNHIDNGAFDLRLGWLDTFLSLAHHLDYAAAGKELDVPAARVRKRIAQLEEWLGRDLLDTHQETPSLDLPFAEEFMLTAIEALTMFDAASRHPLGRTPQRERALLRLADLRTFLAVADKKNYDLAAREIDQTTGNIRRTVHRLEHVLGRKLITGHMWVEVPPEAADFVVTAREIITRLQALRAPIHLANIAAMIRKYRPVLQSNIGIWKRRKRLGKDAKIDLEITEQKLYVMDRCLAEIEEIIPPPPRRSTSAAHIDMDEFLRTREQRAASTDGNEGKDTDDAN